MNIIKKIVIGLAAVILLLVIIGFFLPPDAHVERSVIIKAPVESVFPHVVDLKKNEAWSPWMEGDKTMKVSYGEKTVGVGAASMWTSENSGEGSMTIVEVRDNELIKIELDFKERGTGKAVWKFKSTEKGTFVTEGFTSLAGSNIIGKYFNLFMDKMVGAYMEKGLSNLKRIAEEKK